MSNDWYKKGELPPVGTVCEYNHRKFGWKPVEIIGFHINRAVFAIWDMPEDSADYVYMYCGLPYLFRPNRTETDKLVEQAKAICKSWNDSCGKSIPELFVEANWRPIKPMTEEEFIAQICISFDVDEEFCRELYQGGCRFIEKGE